MNVLQHANEEVLSCRMPLFDSCSFLVTQTFLSVAFLLILVNSDTGRNACATQVHRQECLCYSGIRLEIQNRNYIIIYS